MSSIPLLIARRYLFAKKSQNVINIISMISAIGVFVGTAALLIVLSVFNGLHMFIGTVFGSFDPELKIEPVEGKVFVADSAFMAQVRAVEGVEAASCVLTDNALLRYSKRQMPAMVMGVDTFYGQVTTIDSIMSEGRFQLHGHQGRTCVLGVMLADQLGVRSTSFVSQINFYAPKRVGNINVSMPDKSFIQQAANVSGIFSVKHVDYDAFAIVSLEQARALFCYDNNEVSSIDVRVASGYSVDKVKQALQVALGDAVDVKDRWQQHESFFKVMEVEKFMAYIILTFIIVIAAFNIIGSLSMLIFEKRDSIFILKSMGASRAMVTKVFLFEGCLVSLGGVIAGLVLGIVLVLIQQHFGIISFANSGAYIISAYPVQLQFTDVLVVFVTVVAVGIAAAWYPVKSIVGRYYSSVRL